MQKLRAWGLLLLVLGLDGVAYWAMLHQHDAPPTGLSRRQRGIPARQLSPVAVGALASRRARLRAT